MIKNILLILSLLFLGCSKHQKEVGINGYKPLSQLIKNDIETKQHNGKKVKVWAYLDYENISTCGMANWYFSIKSDRFDGDTIHINTPAAYEFAELYSDLRDKDNRDKNAKVFIDGILHTFDDSSNLSLMLGVEIDIKHSSDIHFK